MTKLSINKIYKLLAVIAVMAVFVPVPYVFTNQLFRGGAVFYMFLIAALLTAFGYAMQSFYGAVISKRVKLRTEYYYDNGFESSENPFKPLHAALPLTIAATVALISRYVFDRLLYTVSKSEDFLIRYDSNSLYPYIGMLAVFLFIAAGVVMWFYPAHRLVSLRTVLSFFGVYCALFAISVMMSVPTSVLTVSIVIFAACSFVVLNQSYIQKSVSGTVTAISNEGKLYNLKLMIVAFAAVIVLLIAFTALFTGIAFLVKFIIAYIAIKMFNSKADPDDRYYDVSEMSEAMSDVMLENQPIGDKFMIVLCVLLFIGALIYFVIRGYDSTQRAIKLIKAWLLHIFLFFMDIRGFADTGNSGEYSYMNYFDEEIKLQDAVIKSYDPATAKKRSYREFVAYLNSLPTATSQIRYAYVTMLSVFCSLGYGIRPSETPRETNERVNERTAENKIDKITAALEAVDYIEKEPSEAECEAAIKDMCRIIENHFGE